METNEKLERLKEILTGYGRVAIAFSGGVDSTFLLNFAVKTLGVKNVLALTADAFYCIPRELDAAADFSEELGVEHYFIQADMYSEVWYDYSCLDEVFKENPEDRCFYCKIAIFSKLLKAALSRPGFVLCDGTNFDDLSAYRPGLEALTELGVRSPLAQAGLTKAEIREEGRKAGLKNWDAPACACLASRIPYGEPVTEAKTEQVLSVEEALQDLGLRSVRARHHGDIVRIELGDAEMKRFLSEPVLAKKLSEAGHEAGFKFVTVDLDGYRTGAFDEPDEPNNPDDSNE